MAGSLLDPFRCRRSQLNKKDFHFCRRRRASLALCAGEFRQNLPRAGRLGYEAQRLGFGSVRSVAWGFGVPPKKNMKYNLRQARKYEQQHLNKVFPMYPRKRWIGDLLARKERKEPESCARCLTWTERGQPALAGGQRVGVAHMQ